MAMRLYTKDRRKLTVGHEQDSWPTRYGMKSQDSPPVLAGGLIFVINVEFR